MLLHDRAQLVTLCRESANTGGAGLKAGAFMTTAAHHMCSKKGTCTANVRASHANSIQTKNHTVHAAVHAVKQSATSEAEHEQHSPTNASEHKQN